jgi:S1-C subfamily serine protease
VVTVNVPNKATLRNSALRNVLKVFVMKCDPNYAQPWQMRPQRSSSGSAFVICNKSRRILSNSHVVRSDVALTTDQFRLSLVICISAVFRGSHFGVVD